MIIDTETSEILYSSHYEDGTTILVLKYINKTYEAVTLTYGAGGTRNTFHGTDQTALGVFHDICKLQEDFLEKKAA